MVFLISHPPPPLLLPPPSPAKILVLGVEGRRDLGRQICEGEVLLLCVGCEEATSMLLPWAMKKILFLGWRWWKKQASKKEKVSMTDNIKLPKSNFFLVFFSKVKTAIFWEIDLGLLKKRVEQVTKMLMMMVAVVVGSKGRRGMVLC